MTEPTPAPAPPPTPSGGAPAPSAGSNPLGIAALALFVAAGVSVGTWIMRAPSEAARAQAELQAARAAQRAGDRSSAARKLARILEGSPVGPHAREAREALADLAREAALPALNLPEATVVLRSALEATEEGGEPLVRPETVAAVLERAAHEAAKDPRGARELVDMLAPALVGTDLDPALRQARRKTLEASLGVTTLTPAERLEVEVALADLDLDEDAAPKALARLDPLATSLEGGEGARVLGLARFKTGSHEAAIAPLTSYFVSHEVGFHQAAEAARTVLETAERRIQKEIETEGVPAALARKLEGADEAKRGALLRDYRRTRLRHDLSVRDTQRELNRWRNLVPVALALGSLSLERSGATAGASRKAALLDAERFYTAVADEAAASDEWCFLVARIRYGLDHPREARSLIDLVLARRRRAPRALIAAAATLSEAGALDEARACSQEAYETATDPKEKERAAQFRAVSAATPAERIEWLEKAGAGGAAKAMSLQLAAQQALDGGRFEEAVQAFDGAIAFYSGEGKTLAPEHHVGFLLVARSIASGDAADLDRAIAAFAPLIAGKDASPQVLDEAADAHLGRAVLRVVAGRVRPEVVRGERPPLELLAFCARDARDLEALTRALGDDPDRKAHVALRERAIAQDPQRVTPWGGLLADGFARRDSAALLDLARRIEGATLDRAADARRIEDDWAGRNDAARAKDLEGRRARAESVLAAARAQGDPASLARALAARAELEREASLCGAVADRDRDVVLSEEAAASLPGTFTRTNLARALLARALERLRATSPALERVAKAHGKLGALRVLALAARLADGATLPAALAADPDGKRALELTGAVLAPEGDEPRTDDHMALVAFGDPRAGAYAKRLAAAALPLAQARAAWAFTPESPEATLELVWLLDLRAAADASRAPERASVLARARAARVSLPWDAFGP